MSDIDKTLDERESTYGVFADQAYMSQGLKAVVHGAPKWGDMSPDKREAIDMILHKVARAVNGMADYEDTWFDISGYATLVKRNLEKKKKQQVLTDYKHIPDASTFTKGEWVDTSHGNADCEPLDLHDI